MGRKRKDTIGALQVTTAPEIFIPLLNFGLAVQGTIAPEIYADLLKTENGDDICRRKRFFDVEFLRKRYSFCLRAS